MKQKSNLAGLGSRAFNVILSEAHEAGMVAGTAKVPVPMVVSEHVNVLDDNSDVKHAYYVPSGVCGFAYVITMEHGNSKFVKHLKKLAGKSNYSMSTGRKYYYGGYYVKSVGEFGQSLEQKEAYASAYAAVLKNYGVNVYTNSRMD